MSISSQITRIAKNVSDSFDAIEAKGVTVPSGSDSDDLPGLIAQIATGGGTTTTIIPQQTVTVSGSYTQLQYDSAIVSGEEYIVTINGTSKTLTAVANSGSVYLLWDSSYQIMIEYTQHGQMYLDINSSSLYGSYTVKVEQESGGGTPAISIVDTADSAGGTVRTITALNISDTTAVAADVASGKYFYTANGTKTQGTATAGVNCPTFTLTFNSTATAIQSVTCDKTYAECGTYRENGVLTAVVIMTRSSFEPIKLGATSNASSGTLYYYVSYGDAVASILIQYTSSSLTATLDPVPYRESTDLSASNLTVTAPAGYYESNATKTLTDANLIAGNIKNGISIFGVAGTYQGSGGLVYETGTYTPASDVAQPTISFANTHTATPFFVIISDVTGTSQTTNNSEIVWTQCSWYRAFGEYINTGSSTNLYTRRQSYYRGTSTTTSTSGGGDTYDSTSYVSSSEFKPSSGTSYYWRSGRTYKWIAVWAPTT